MSTPDLEQYMYGNITLEAVFKAYKLETDPAFCTHLYQLGYNYRKPRKSYSYPQFKTILYAMIDHVSPKLPLEIAAGEVGMRTFDGFTQTVLGRVVLAPLHLVSFERGLTMVVAAVDRESELSARVMVHAEPGYVRIAYNNDPIAVNKVNVNFVVGIYQGLCKYGRVQNPTITTHLIDPLHVEIEIRWQV